MCINVAGCDVVYRLISMILNTWCFCTRKKKQLQKYPYCKDFPQNWKYALLQTIYVTCYNNYHMNTNIPVVRSNKRMCSYQYNPDNKVHGANTAHLGPTGPRWAPCWPHKVCYLGCFWRQSIILTNAAVLSIRLKGTYFGEIQSKIHRFHASKCT